MIFLLGASDPEMAEIARVATAAGHTVRHAQSGGRRVHPGNAYRADADAYGDVYVECGPSAPVATVVDHHNPGDPGWGSPPEEYLRGSSLGQVLVLLGLEATPTQRLIAAADHCLAAAYAGQCPGVDPEELLAFRCESRAAFQRRPVADVSADIAASIELLQAVGKPVVDVRYAGTLPELPEAAARCGVAAIYRIHDDRSGRWKVGIIGAGAGTVPGTEPVAAFLRGEGAARDLVDLYGDPVRGYAGGYEVDP